jgi:hypothetical protein
VIATYGPTPNGQQNDGINIALENTPVKAAEDGVIVCRQQLKGYGNRAGAPPERIRHRLCPRQRLLVSAATSQAEQVIARPDKPAMSPRRNCISRSASSTARSDGL